MKISDKRRLVRLLATAPLDAIRKEFLAMPPAEAVNPLFAGLSHSSEVIHWHAVAAMGPVVAALADQDMEAGRIVMRRLMWSLNDESGGIGWGAPEAMAEILSCHDGLAAEYAHIPVSYMREDGNFLELEALQRGVVWAVGRLGQGRRDLMEKWQAGRYVVPYLESTDATVRGIAAWSSGILGAAGAMPLLQALQQDTTAIRHFVDGQLVDTSVARLAAHAVQAISGKQDKAGKP